MASKKEKPQILVVEDDGQQQEPAPEVKRRKSYEGRTHDTRFVEAKVSEADSVEDLEWALETKKRMPIGWIFLALFVLVAAVGAALFTINKSGESKEDKLDSEAEKIAEAEQEVESLERLVTLYLKASSVEERLQYVRSSERVKPLMEEWYSRNPLEQDSVSHISSIQFIKFEEKDFWVLAAIGKKRHPLLIEKIDDGSFKVDWETHVAYSSMDWDVFIKDKPLEAKKFRIRVQPDFYFVHEYADERIWDCYRLTHPSSDQVLFGFVKKGTFVAKEMSSLVTIGSMKPLVLKLKFQQGYKATQAVEITEFVSGNWLNLN